MEYLEDAIESNKLPESGDGTGVMEVEHLADGTPIYKTGDPEIDALEREFAEQVEKDIQEERRKGIKYVTPASRFGNATPVVDSEEDALEDALAQLREALKGKE